MKTLMILTVLCLGIPGLAQTQTNAGKGVPSGSYYSWQHPEWPPMPSPATSNLVTFRIVQTNLAGSNNFMMDDRTLIYAPPVPNEIPGAAYITRYNLSLFLRHPEEISKEIAMLKVKLTDPELPPHERRDYSRRLQDCKEMAILARTNTPAPYSLQEELMLIGSAKAGDLVRTNPAGVLEGIKTETIFLRASEAALPMYEYLGHLAKRALESTNRADFENFLTFKRQYIRDLPGRVTITPTEN